MRKKLSRHARGDDDSNINLTPMLDVVFIMLIFFIVTATFIKQAGIEVYRPSHRVNDVKRLDAICSDKALMCSGGSDWHTPDAGRSLGDFFVDAAKIEDLLTVGGI